MVFSVATTMPHPVPNKTIVLIDISAKNYSFTKVYQKIIDIVSTSVCPCCNVVGGFKRHGWYSKYYYTEELLIVRIRCSSCNRTHAVLPSFSLPGTSVGIEELEQYLKDRQKGKSRRKAAEVFTGLCLHEGYAKQVEKRVTAAVNRAKALFPGRGDDTVFGYHWLVSVVGTDEQRPLWRLNTMCLSVGYNPVFFSRSSVLLFRQRKTGIVVSHNRDSVLRSQELINSS
jgi:hypothetical protein